MMDYPADYVTQKHHQIADLHGRVKELEKEIAKAEARFQEMLKAEHDISDAYIRLRVILGAMNAPSGKIWEYTEVRARALMAERDAALTALSELVASVSVVHGQHQDAERFLDARTAAVTLLDRLRATEGIR